MLGRSFSKSFATRHRTIKNKLLRMPTGEDNPRSPARVNRYLTALYHALAVAFEQSECQQLLPLIVLAVSTGARKMEGLGLPWRDVGFS